MKQVVSGGADGIV